MRDDRFNALKQEFDGAPEDTDIALLCVADMVKAACFYWKPPNIQERVAILSILRRTMRNMLQRRVTEENSRRV